MDLGLRNAKLNFRQQEKSHLMENMIYLELVRRGYSVDVGVVEVTRVKDGKKKQSQYEIDFVVNTGQEKIYIQSALNVDTEEKKDQETFSLKNSGDLFRKIVIVDGNTNGRMKTALCTLVSFHFCWKNQVLASERASFIFVEDFY